MEVTDIFSFYIYTFDDAYLVINNLRKDLAVMDSQIPSYALIGNVSFNPSLFLQRFFLNLFKCSSSLSPTIILSRAAVKVLATGRQIDSNSETISSLTGCLAHNQISNLCTCLDKYGLKKFNLETDYDGKLK